MKRQLYILIATLSLLTANSFGQNHSDLIGTVYRHKKELKVLDSYSEWKATVIDKKDKDGNEYAIVWLNDTITHRQLVFLERMIRDSASQIQPDYLIMDTLSILFKSKDDWLSTCECYQNNVFNPEIIAFVLAKDNVEYFTKIKRAWVADILTGKIIPLKNKKGVKCVNQDFGVGCDDSE